MTTIITSTQAAALLIGISDRMIAGKNELTALDAELGDGDLGRTISRGFAAIKDDLTAAESPESDLGKLLYKEGKTFSNTAPSSFGALFATLLMKGGMALKGKESATFGEIADAAQTALEALMERGKAKIGDKTMLDALHPAIEAMRSVKTDATLLAFFLAAADAAQRGAEETKNMQSQIGRASWQGERSAGKMDPGARAIAMMLQAAAAYLEAQESHNKE